MGVRIFIIQLDCRAKLSLSFRGYATEPQCFSEVRMGLRETRTELDRLPKLLDSLVWMSLDHQNPTQRAADGPISGVGFHRKFELLLRSRQIPPLDRRNSALVGDVALRIRSGRILRCGLLLSPSIVLGHRNTEGPARENEEQEDVSERCIPRVHG